MTAEEIVRELADTSPDHHGDCRFCYGIGAYYESKVWTIKHHEYCVWLAAQQWVERQS